MFFVLTGIVMFCVLLELIFCFAAAAQQIRNLTLPNTEHGTIHWHTFRKGSKCDFFSIQITTTVKKANLAAEPHGSLLQGCTVRPRKGAGKSSMAGGRYLGFRLRHWKGQETNSKKTRR